jgi:hypothetical protein
LFVCFFFVERFLLVVDEFKRKGIAFILLYCSFNRTNKKQQHYVEDSIAALILCLKTKSVVK